MILFFGTRPGKRRERRLPGVRCPYCDQAALTAIEVPQYIHLFWIPIYRLKPAVWFECLHCKRGYDRSDCSPEMLEALESIS